MSCDSRPFCTAASFNDTVFSDAPPSVFPDPLHRNSIFIQFKCLTLGRRGDFFESWCVSSSSSGPTVCVILSLTNGRALEQTEIFEFLALIVPSHVFSWRPSSRLLPNIRTHVVHTHSKKATRVQVVVS